MSLSFFIAFSFFYILLISSFLFLFSLSLLHTLSLSPFQHMYLSFYPICNIHRSFRESDPFYAIYRFPIGAISDEFVDLN